jgi:hypothetical protein
MIGIGLRHVELPVRREREASLRRRQPRLLPTIHEIWCRGTEIASNSANDTRFGLVSAPASLYVVAIELSA